MVRVSASMTGLYGGSHNRDLTARGGLEKVIPRGRTRVGTLIYDGADGFTFDDRVLAHLQAVVQTKLRRREGFLLIWTDRTAGPDGVLRSIWLDPSISLQFVFARPELPELNRDWLTILGERANSNSGLMLEDDLRAEIREELPEGTYRASRTRNGKRREGA